MEKYSLSSSKVALTALIHDLVKVYFKRSELDYLQISESNEFKPGRIIFYVTVRFVNSCKMHGDIHLIRNEEKRLWEPFEMMSLLKFPSGSLGVRFGKDPESGKLITENIQ